MSINKNISIDASDCKSCSNIGSVTISPTLFTDKEVTYGIHGHGLNLDGGNCEESLISANAYTDKKIKELITSSERIYEKMKYEIVGTPDGTLVDYGDKEIRIMCPVGTIWSKQVVGEGGNANMYYMGFKAYAPNGAVSFKEGDRGVIEDELFTFDDAFAGTDEFGRNYSICWLALASYDETSDTWTYFGKNSSTDRYIGWTYVVEWYNADGVIIESDCIRINLTNEECHYSTKSSEVGNAVDEAVNTSKTYTDEQIQKLLESVGDVTDEDIESLFN